VLGHAVTRVEDPRFLTGRASYVGNLRLDGAAHVAFVRSSAAHARLLDVDTADARDAPGVLAVVTADDLRLPGPVAMEPGLPRALARQVLARAVVRYVGEAVAAVVAETPQQAVDAVELVSVSFDPLPVVVDPQDALKDETLLFPEHGTNVAFDLAELGVDDDFSDEFFEGCEVVVRQRISGQRLAPSPMEVRAAAATWTDGRLHLWASTQVPHRLRDEVAELYGLDGDDVHVVSPDVGGGFGAKAAGYPEYFVMGELARIVGRPVAWVETRSESMLGLGHGRAQSVDVELGGTRDGKVLAARFSIVQDAGAYPMLGAMLPRITRLMGPGVYDIPKFAGRAKSVVTNTVPVVAYRGAGRPEATYAIERAMDLYAAELGRDPAEVRRRNLIASDAFPHTTATGLVYDSGAYLEALDRVLDESGYKELREEQQLRRDRGDTVQMGIGVSVYVEITNPRRHGDFGAVCIERDGTAQIRAGTHSHGQGHATVYGMVVSELLGVPLEHTQFVQGDTDLVPRGTGTFGSRSVQTAGAAVHLAATAVLDQARALAVEMLEASPEDIEVLPQGAGLGVAGVPGERLTWAELAAAAEERGAPLEATSDFDPHEASYPFGAHVAVVDVDTETGDARLRRITALDDCGRVLNPLLLEGQIHGGLAQGISQVLYEQMLYDEDGNPQTASFADYGIPYAPDLPPFDLITQQTDTPLNALGAKGIGESGTIGSIPAVANAVVDALSPFGVRHLDLPATPERVWNAITGGRTEEPDQGVEPPTTSAEQPLGGRRTPARWRTAAAGAAGAIAVLAALAGWWLRRRTVVRGRRATDSA
jgi:carbon-monoxide dehydrogenase large subunit